MFYIFTICIKLFFWHLFTFEIYIFWQIRVGLLEFLDALLFLLKVVNIVILLNALVGGLALGN